MNYSKEIFPLNNFVLLSKGWLKLKKDNSTNSLESIVEALKLDGYGYVKTWGDVSMIVSRHFNDHNKWKRLNRKQPWSLEKFIYELTETKYYCDLDDKPDNSPTDIQKIIVYTMMRYFRYDCGRDEIVLSTEQISDFTGQKRLFEKHGKFIFSNSHPGMTYKTMNRIVNNSLRNTKVN